MKEILQYSDFALKISFISSNGKPITVSKFKFSYSTALSRSVVAEFDGQTYSPNCRPDSDGIVVLFENPRFNVGQLRVNREYSITSSLYGDGVKDFVEICELPITIVQSLNQNPSQEVTIPTAVSQGEVIVLDTVVMEAIPGPQGTQGIQGIQGIQGEKGDKGDKGEKGDAGAKGESGSVLDRSRFDEQIIEGQYWIGRGGAKKQLYGRRIRVSQDAVAGGNTGLVHFTDLQPMDSLCSMEGFFEGEDNNGGVQSAFPGFGIGACILRYNSTGGNIANSLTILFIDINPQNIGKPFTVDLFLTYTKL